MIKNGNNLVEDPNNHENSSVNNFIEEKKRLCDIISKLKEENKNLILDKNAMADKYEFQISQLKEEKKALEAKYVFKFSE